MFAVFKIRCFSDQHGEIIVIVAGDRIGNVFCHALVPASVIIRIDEDIERQVFLELFGVILIHADGGKLAAVRDDGKTAGIDILAVGSVFAVVEDRYRFGEIFAEGERVSQGCRAELRGCAQQKDCTEQGCAQGQAGGRAPAHVAAGRGALVQTEAGRVASVGTETGRGASDHG